MLSFFRLCKQTPRFLLPNRACTRSPPRKIPALFSCPICTSPPKQAPPVVLFVLRYVAKGVAYVGGRNFRRWWRALPKDKREQYWTKLKEQRWKIIGSGGLCAALGYYYYDTHLEETPITGRQRFSFVTSAQIEELSKEEFLAICAVYAGKIVPPQHPCYVRVVQVANRLLLANRDIPQVYTKNWTVTVLHDPDNVNAFVLPNGNIFVFTSMLEMCSTDDELGIVLAHEIAHSLLGHSAENVSREHWIEAVKVVVMATASTLLPTFVTSFFTYLFGEAVVDTTLNYPYDRLLENEADQVGIQLAAKACFDVRAAVAFWSKMQIVEELNEGKQIEWLSTHPSHRTRQEKLQEQLPSAINMRQYCKCSELPLADPRDEVEAFRQAAAKAKLQNQTIPTYVAIRLHVPDLVDVSRGI